MDIRYISIQQLVAIFGGKPVKIAHTGNPALQDFVGMCETFRAVGSDMDILLNGGRIYTFTPDTLTDSWVEGSVPGLAGRRRLELASD